MRWYPDEQACAAGKPKGALAFGAETSCTLWTQAEQQQLTIAEGKKRLTLRASRFEDLAEWREKIQAIVDPRQGSAGSTNGAEASQSSPGGGNLNLAAPPVQRRLVSGDL